MNILIVTPAPQGSRKGNRVTALRWAGLLRQLGHRVVLRQEYHGEPCHVMVALHARRSFPAIDAFRKAHPNGVLILALTGTDLYEDIRTDRLAQRSLELASRLIVLQPCGTDELPQRLRAKARVIYQSAEMTSRPLPPKRNVFEVCVLGHLREVKDPFRTAYAVRLLPASSRIRVLHIGSALSPDMEAEARREQETNPRYRWLGDRPRWQALRLLARSRLLVLSSHLEGGANAISEAIAAGVPVLASRISGSIGLLGPDYPGYFPVGDTATLAALLERVEIDAKFYVSLQRWVARLSPLVEPARERLTWKSLLREFSARPRRREKVR